MTEPFDFIVIGGGSAGAVVAARLSEDPNCRVALIEAGGPPPDVELMPAATASLQQNPETDWMYTADAGGVGLGFQEPGRMVVPRGKMLGGSSGINYMAYVRGHPADYDAWSEGGADGWSYAEVLPYFRKSERLAPSADIVVDHEAHGQDGPMGVSVRSPIQQGARDFVAAAEAAGIPRGDYNGRNRGSASGVVSLLQTTTWEGKRQSTYRAFLEGRADQRPNLEIITHAQVTRIVIADADGGPRATGVEFQTRDGQRQTVTAKREIILSAGAIGSPHVLMLSGIGPRQELEAVGVDCLVDSPHVGKHLQDHIQVPLFFAAPGAVTMTEVAISMGPDALRAPAGPLPADPADDAAMPAELQALKAEAERRLEQWMTTGESLVSSSLYDAAAWVSTGLGDTHSHDMQIACIPCGYTEELFRDCLKERTAELFDDVEARVGVEAETHIVLANPVLPHSEGEIRLTSADPNVHPAIDMNYLGDPHDVAVMIAGLRRALDVVAHWPPERGIGPVMMSPSLARKHGHSPGDEPSDALLEDHARHHSWTVYHETSTCRIGDVVDSHLRVQGVAGLRVADASVMPKVVSGNTNAACIMIGEKAAEMVAREHGVELGVFVGG